MKKYIEWIIIAIAIIPFLITIALWEKLPALIPSHFNIDGVPDSFESKGKFVIAQLVITVIVYFLLRYIPQMDPNKKKLLAFSTILTKIRLLLHLLLSIISLSIIYFALEKSVDTTIITLNIMGVFMLLLGNSFYSLPKNYFIGIRVPWTLADDENWRKTHRFGAWIWVVSSLFFIVLLFLLPIQFRDALLMSYILCIAIVPIIYSFTLYYKSQKK